MYKIVTLFLCLFFSVNSAFAENIVPIQARATSPENRTPEDPPISASINKNIFRATFGEDIGSVVISIATADGSNVLDLNIIGTPNGASCLIPLAGDYVVTFTLSNGDEYYGEFTIV